MSRVFVITGPSGVGKGTLIRALRERVPGIELSVSVTTRAPRPGEVDGRDYHFLTDEEFDRLLVANEFLEQATYSGKRYGTLRSEIARTLERGASVVLEIDVQGARQVRDRLDDAVLVFIAPPDPAALRNRLEGRATDAPEAIASRLETAARELEARDEFQHVVVNDTVERAADELERIVRIELER